MNYGEEYGETYRHVGVPALRRLLSALRREERKYRKLAMEAKIQLVSEVNSCQANGIGFAADKLAETIKKETT